MSFWFFPQVLSDEARDQAIADEELQLPAEGLPDLLRAQAPDQIAQWLRKLHPGMPPEQISARTENYWRLSHELLAEDYLIVRTDEGRNVMLAEITGVCRKESRAMGLMHIWPAHWHATNIVTETMPALSAYFPRPGLTEISDDEEVLKALRPYVPTLKRSNYRLFKWIALITLIFELFYFWPSSHY